MMLLAGIMLGVHAVGTMSYSSRIAGVTSRHLMFVSAIYNIPIFFVRMAQTLLLPLLTKWVEEASAAGIDVESDMRWILFAGTIGTLLGALGIPLMNRLLVALSRHVEEDKTGLTGMVSGFHWKNLFLRFQWPGTGVFRNLSHYRGLPWKVLLPTFVGIFLFSTGVLSACYAAYLIPAYRATAVSMAPVVNGISTAIMFTVVDPQLGLLTDRTLHGKVSEMEFKRIIVWIVVLRLLATLTAQIFFLPLAYGIVWASENL